MNQRRSFITLLLKVESVCCILSRFAHPQICSKKLVVKRVFHSWTVVLTRTKGRKTSIKKFYSRHQRKNQDLYFEITELHRALWRWRAFFLQPKHSLTRHLQYDKNERVEKSPEILKISSHWRIRDKLRWIIFCCCKNDGQRTWCAVSW